MGYGERWIVRLPSLAELAGAAIGGNPTTGKVRPMKKAKRLKDTTKAELKAALDAAGREITQLTAANETLHDANKALDRWVAEAQTAQAEAVGREAGVRSDMATLTKQLAEQDATISAMKGILNSLQQQLAEAQGIAKAYSDLGLNLDLLVTNHLNLSALRRVLDATDQDEPVFVLRATDKAAPDVVEWWANRAVAIGATNHRKLGSALQRAGDMRNWAARNGCKIPD